MKFSCSAIPYYLPPLKERKYIDGGIKEPLSLKYLIKKYPNKKIIAIVNFDINRVFSDYIKNFIEGIVANAMFKGTFSDCFMKREKNIREDLRIAMNNKNILLIHPKANKKNESWTIDPSQLKQAHRDGMKQAKKQYLRIEFLN